MIDMSDHVIPLFRAEKALDTVLPETTYKGATGVRFWTNSKGSFRVHVEGQHPNKVLTFVDEVHEWRVQVPTTDDGLDALVIAMILAGAIEPHGLNAAMTMDAVRRMNPTRGQFPAFGWTR